MNTSHSDDDSDARFEPTPAFETLPRALQDVLESAGRLQELIPEAVLVGGSAAAFYAQHRASYDHDHTLGDLRDRFEIVLEALEREGDFVLNRLTPGKIILGELGGIETGLRQLIRRSPLEVQEFTLPSGRTLTVPTMAETLRIKAYLIVTRNQVRDYLDVAALSARYGLDRAAGYLRSIDDYYADDKKSPLSTPVRDQLVRQLAEPAPKDASTITRLDRYKALERRWQDWSAVEEVCNELAVRIVQHVEKE